MRLPWISVFTRSAAFAGVVAVLSVAACAPHQGDARQENGEGVTGMVELEVRPERTTFTTSEEIAIGVRIVNNQSAAIEIPDPAQATSTQPVYSLMGPEGGTSAEFNMLSVTSGTAINATPADAVPAKLLTIQPGESWSGVVALDSFVDLSQTGEYRLRAKLDWQNVKAQSEEVRFQIRPMEIRSIHIGLGVRPIEHAEGEGAFIQQGGDSGQLYTFTFQEVRPSIGEAIARKPIFRVNLGPQATDVAVPWRNSPFFDEMLRWIVWREGSSVMALSSASETPDVCALPSNSYHIVHPPLKTADGPLDVLVVSPEQNELSLVRFSAKFSDEPQPGSIVWKVSLPAKPINLVAALAADGTRHVAFTSRVEGGFDIFHSRYQADGSIEPFRSVKVENAQPFPSVQPCLFVDSGGNANFGVVAFGDDKAESCILVEAFIPAGESAPRFPGVVQLGMLSEKPLRGAVLFAEKDGAIGRREVVVELSEHQLLKLGDEGELVPVANPGIPTNPLLLAPGKNTTYILYTDSERGFHLEPL